MVFQVGYTDEGKLQVVVVDVYIDGGFTYSCFTMLNKVFANLDHGKNLKSFMFDTHEKSRSPCHDCGEVCPVKNIQVQLAQICSSGRGFLFLVSTLIRDY